MMMQSSGHDEVAVYDRIVQSIQGLPPDEAIRKLKEFLKTFPSFALAHNDLGVLYHHSGNPTLALAHYEKAARLQSDNSLFKKNLADFYAVELDWVEEAIDIYLEVVRRNPRDAEALVALGKLGSALAGSRLLEAPPERPELEVARKELKSARSEQELLQEARQLIANDDYKAARATLEELNAQKPDNAVVLNDLGVICYKLGDIPAAQGYYERAFSLQPENPDFARNIADLYFAELNRADDAIRIYLELHRKMPRDVETIINLGHICSAVGQPGEARTFYRRALEVEPWNSEARKALSSLTESVVQPPVRPAMSVDDLLNEARKHVQQGQPAEARKLLEQAIAHNPAHAVAHNDLGVVAFSMGDLGTSLNEYEQAVRLDPANAGFSKNLADLYFVAAGRPDDAIKIYLDLFRKFPRDIEVLSSLGQICQAVGRPDEAKTFYRRALEIEPWNREIREVLKGMA